MKQTTMKAWAVIVRETTGRNAGQYFLSEALEMRSSARLQKTRLLKQHPKWDVKAVPCTITFKAPLSKKKVPKRPC